MSHVEESEVEKFGDFLKANLEKNDLKVTHHCGPINDNLGIGIEYSEKGKFKVSMIPYLCGLLEGFSEKIHRMSRSRVRYASSKATPRTSSPAN